MKTKNLDQAITTLSGAEVMLAANKPLTYRNALVSACETYQAEPGSGNMLKAYQLGMKIMDAKGELEFAQDELDFLKKVVEDNRAFIAVVIGRLVDFINS